MRSINRRFIQIKEDNPLLSDFICYSRSVKRQEFSKKAIMKWFNLLVDKNDYAPTDKKRLIEHLVELTNL